MIAVYADETGTGGIPKSGKEPAPGVYGLLATPEMWDGFKDEWKAMLIKYRVSYFHFRELNPDQRKKRQNPYYGWSNDLVDDFIYDMATVTGSGPIPFGGNASVIRNVGKSPTPRQLNKVYRTAFYGFFSDFKATMNQHFPAEKEKAAFFFSDNENEEWIEILNRVIRDARNHDSRIGEFAFVNDRDERGIPCQAADLFAYINRQNSGNIYDVGYNLPPRVLDIIVGRYAFPQGNPGYELRKLKDQEWSDLIADMRAEKKAFEITKRLLNEPDAVYYPTQHHPFFKSLFASYKML